MTPKVGPRFSKLVEDGTAYEIDGQAIGIAADGKTVLLGDTFDQAGCDTIERYLTDHPTPDTW